MITKRCTKCKKEKPLVNEHFWFNKERNKFNSICKECCRRIKKQYREKNKEKRKLYYKTNKIKISEQRKQYRKKNKDGISEHEKLRYENIRMRNRSKSDSEIFDGTMKRCYCCKQQKQSDRRYWFRANSQIDGIDPLCKQCRNKKQVERLKNDLNFKFRQIISRLIWIALKKNDGSKNSFSILQKLPYTMQQLKDHLESLWEPWMSWDNYGPIDLARDTWQIDHVIPQSALPYDSMDHPNFLKCWDLSNLRPMKAIDNIRKGNKIEQGGS